MLDQLPRDRFTLQQQCISMFFHVCESLVLRRSDLTVCVKVGNLTIEFNSNSAC